MVLEQPAKGVAQPLQPCLASAADHEDLLDDNADVIPALGPGNTSVESAASNEDEVENPDRPTGFRFAVVFGCLFIGDFFVGYVGQRPGGASEHCYMVTVDFDMRCRTPAV